MYATNQFRKGLKIEVEGTPYQIVHFEHVSPGKGSAFTRTKLRNILNGNVTEKTFKSNEKVDKPNTQDRDMQFLYPDPEGYHFMDTGNYEQIAISEELIGSDVGYLQEGIVVKVTYYNNRPIGIELPNFIEAVIVETDPAFKGDTVSGGTKPAKLETGAMVNVPFHLKEGDKIKVDTRDGSYYEKVK
ncbi:MAG: elongation factor P [Bdellovibrionaceae bacterium]|nr:elongation factor P [Pseudobdellovibrionaceae bacterium]|tara:strand:+ start:1173 stop:1733 length:561 start_codon:yes stop_codon:yes gene_type:complete